MQKGFTLIELMITIAIVGILTSIAMVTYTNYTKKTMVSIGLSEISSLKAEYEMTVNENYSNLGSLSNIQLSSSKYCTLEVNAPDATTQIAEKALVCHLKKTELFGLNAMVYLSRNTKAQYNCYTKNIDQKFLPKNCFPE